MTIYDLLDKTQLQKLFENGREENSHKNHVPVAYLKIPPGGFSFLITEIDEQMPEYGFGLLETNCHVTIQTIRFSKLFELGEKQQMPLRSMKDFEGKYNLAVYAQVAAELGALFLENQMSKNSENLFEKYNKGKNANPDLDLLNLKQRFIWT